MEQSEYWKKRCELAESYIDESPCDPDITTSQLAAYSAWNHFKSLNIPRVSKRSELLIGLLTMLEKGGGNEFIDKAEIVAKYEANL